MGRAEREDMPIYPRTVFDLCPAGCTWRNRGVFLPNPSHLTTLAWIEPTSAFPQTGESSGLEGMANFLRAAFVESVGGSLGGDSPLQPMSRARLLGMIVAVLPAAIVAPAPVASAHGPCGACLSTFRGPPGVPVTVVRTTAVEVAWNPPPAVLLLGVPDDGGYYVPTEPSLILAAAEERERNLTFEVPDVAPGRYLVVIYDGSENRQHYTWDYFRVLASPSPPTKPNRGSDILIRWAVFLAAAGALGVLSLLVWRRRRRRGKARG